MKKLILCLAIVLVLNGCSNNQNTKGVKAQTINLIGTWKMIYAEIKEKDSIQIKDLSTTAFIKIINESHFAFFNQEYNSSEKFYGGG